MGSNKNQLGRVLKFAEIHIDSLIVNPSNDRHGPTPSEKDAISWLFRNKTKEMRNLASKIADAGRVYDSPLVVKEGDKFLVRDGNRRVTCLKLIHEPMNAPSGHQAFFTELKSRASGRLALTVQCQIEDNGPVVEQILETRHNGVQDGIGQVGWGPREKANHANRVSGRSDYAWSQRIEEYLVSEGHRDQALSIKRSTLDRLLKAKKSRERFGFDVDAKGKLKSTQSKEKTTALLLKLVEDMNKNELTLNELLKAEDREAYIDVIASKGLLPNSADAIGAKSPTENNTSQQEPSSQQTSTSKKRTSVIPRHVNYQFNWKSGQTKIHLAWEELQHKLLIARHPFAICVLLRALIELIVRDYQNKNDLVDKDSLVKNLRLINDHLLSANKIGKEQHKDAERIIVGSTKSNSIESLHRVLHSQSHMLNANELTTMWDCIEPLLLAILRESQK